MTSVLYLSHLCMKYSLGIPNFLEEISSLSHSVVFLYFFAFIAEKAFLCLLAILWISAFRCLYLSFSPLLFASLLFTAIFLFASARFYREFSGSLVVRIRGFHCGLGSVPGGGLRSRKLGCVAQKNQK